MELYEICMLVVGAALFLFILFSCIKNYDYLKYSALVRPILSACLGVLSAVKGMNIDNKTVNTMTTVVEAAIKAAGYAEELWLEGSIEKDKRAEAAEDYIQNVLRDAGIEITDQIRTVISGAIALICFIMPHHEEAE